MSKFNVIIPAAGTATRLRPLTSNCSKAMVRLHGRPAISYILEKLYNEGAGEIVIVDGKFDDIREYCKQHFPNVKFIKQTEMNGPREAIVIGVMEIQHVERPIVVWLGDTLVFDENLPLGEDFLLTKYVDDHHQWCMWDGNIFYNKPEQYIKDAVALVGVYSFSDGVQAERAMICSDGYDISEILERYEPSFKRVMTEHWHDIGTLSSFQKTCAAMLSQKARAFNSFEYDSELNVIEKKGKDISAELKWYRNCSPTQKLFTPRLLDDGGSSLRLSYESGVLLSDLFLHEDVNESTANYLLRKLFRIMKNNFWVMRHPLLDTTFDTWHDACRNMWYVKSALRLNEKTEHYDGLSEEVKEKILNLADYASSNYDIVDTIHGDLHGGNIIYDPYNDSVKMIDPRGKFGDLYTNSGDIMYDLAKMSHDFYHGYGSIVANKKYPPFVREIFVDIIRESGYNIDYVNALGCLLIATCIPLHHDDHDRQMRMKHYVENYFEHVDCRFG